ncbi:MAG: preprotein translocase subunit YajC [Clostridiales bacterium]|nr:preprotein translocase subunit YajC [Clostridiales bacterium]
MNLLLASQNTGNLVLIIVLIVACAGMFVLSYFKNKKYMQNQKEMQDKLEVGAKVLTKTFIYGTIEKVTETTDGKIVLIKSGEGDKVSYLEMNVEAIYSIDSKEEIVDLEEVQSEEKVENVNAEAVEEVKEEPKKRTTKKTTTKKTTKK